MEVLLYLFGALAIAAALVIGLAMTKPNRFSIVRSLAMNAAPDKIYPYLADLKKNHLWVPFDVSPNLTRTYSGPAMGAGASYHFTGSNKDGGEGRLTVLEATENHYVKIRLEMIRPMKGDNIVTYRLTQRGGATEVEWAMEGGSPFISKVIQVFMSFDKMLGGQFDKGLQTLKGLVER